ncbi:MAG: PEP-CTERM sorting domain-containing protein [Opitutales bacterium]|nr:PEP-CTERM sorting domain-containing protein [Opitutales bacterium]
MINDIIVADSKNSTLDNLTISVGGKTFVANDESALNQYLNKIEILGYENYEKTFVVNENNKSVSLHLSKIPEPSAFGLLAGIGALALVVSRRRR